MVLVATRRLAGKAQALGLTNSTRWGAISYADVMQTQLWRPNAGIADRLQRALLKGIARPALALLD
jgi:hypothetical protein